MAPHRQAFHYNMNHKKRGLALIFVHQHFDRQLNLRERRSAKVDLELLNDAFVRQGFEIESYWDSTVNEINKRTKDVAERDHTDNDCIVIAIVTHGESGGYLFAHNRTYSLDNIFQHFTADRCPTLAGKPKLFFIQACRGKNCDNGMTVKRKQQIHTDGDGLYSNISYRIPLHADFLIAYSTIPDFISFTNEKTGSPFIRALVEEFNDNFSSQDILTMLTFVNQRVAIAFEAYCPDEPEDNKKQMPCFTSMLTRILRFF